MKLSQTIEQNQWQNLSQRALLRQDQRIALLLELTNSIHGQNYSIEAQCPDCNRKLTPAEVVYGFLDNVNDFTTICPKCQARFEPRLAMLDQHGSKTSLPFLCSKQALHKLKESPILTPEEFTRRSDLVAAYRSLIVHHGTITAAYKSIGIEYPHTELEGWKNKIRPFLGRLSDTDIANSLGKSVTEVALFREDCGIRKKILK